MRVARAAPIYAWTPRCCFPPADRCGVDIHVLVHALELGLFQRECRYETVVQAGALVRK